MISRFLQELISHRDLLGALTLKELKTRYKSATLGFLWAFLNPLLQMLVLSVIFTFIVRIPVEKYPLFLFAGLLPWIFFTQSVTSGTSSLVQNRELIKKTAFPRAVLPLSAVFSSLINFLLSLLLFLPVLFLFGFLPSFSFLFLPFVILLHLVLTIGIVLIASSLDILYRDVSFIIQALLLAWFYLTPILYPLSMVPEKFLPLYGLNPMVGIVSLYHFSLLGRELSSLQVILPTLIFSFTFLVFGVFLFKKREPYFADWA